MIAQSSDQFLFFQTFSASCKLVYGMYLYPLAMPFLGKKHSNMFNANKEFVFAY